MAQGCSAKRVIIISFNRAHQYGSLKAVQAELSPMVSELAPEAARLMEGAIPFMTTQEGIGSRSVVKSLWRGTDCSCAWQLLRQPNSL